MAAKKNTKPTQTDNRSEADKRDEQRKQFVAQKKAQGVSVKEANTQFYVQTRAKELAAKGVKVDAAKRKELRQNYESGSVKRAGFGVTPATGGKPTSKPSSNPTKMPKRTSAETKSYTKRTVTPMGNQPKEGQKAAEGQVWQQFGMGNYRGNQDFADRMQRANAELKRRGYKPSRFSGFYFSS